MKNILVLIISLVFSFNLHSQEHEYFKKIDFEFDSGINQIYIYQYQNHYHYEEYTNPFIISTENNKLYYFENLDSSAVQLNFPDTLHYIKKMSMCYYLEKFTIFILADYNLFYSDNLGESWNVVETEDDISVVEDFAIDARFDDTQYTWIVLISGGIPYVNYNTAEKFIKRDYGLDDVKITHLQCDGYKMYGLSENNDLYSLPWNEYNDAQFETHIDIQEYINHFRINYSYPENIFHFITDGSITDGNKFFSTNPNLSNQLYDSLNISCFTVADWVYLLSSFSFLEHAGEVIFGTEDGGIYFYIDYAREIVKIGNELDGKRITDIETNYFTNPSFCLVGTGEGELFVGKWEIGPNDVEGNKFYEEISISPNPATDFIEIKNLSLPSPLAERDFKIGIFDVLGKNIKLSPLYEEGARGCVFDVSHLHPGIYFVRVGDEFLKFVKF